MGSFISPHALADNAEEVLLSDKNFILITFDDGLKEQYQFAVPILKSLQLQALFFINSINHIEKKISQVHKIHLLRSVVSSKELYADLVAFAKIDLADSDKEKAQHFYRFDDKSSAEVKYLLNVILPTAVQKEFIDLKFRQEFDENQVLENLYMSEDEIKSLAKNGQIGSHTHSHIPLGIQPEEIMYSELHTSKNYLEQLCQVPLHSVSYPYGSGNAVSEKVAAIAKETGYKLGFTTLPGNNTSGSNPLLLNRFDTNDLPGGKNEIMGSVNSEAK
ncbi:polysaccharide deacetylase family protein [Flavobacterium pallidum]|nr:polysaccharide deacetylase family protein [Flavobacterium pallidum]